MLLSDWLKRLSTPQSSFRFKPHCAHSRRRQSGRVTAGSAGIVSQTESLEERLLMSAADVDLTNIPASAGFQVDADGVGNGFPAFGEVVRAAGDVNGDGFEDVIIGYRYKEDANFNVNSGAAYVIYGKSTGFTPPPDINNFQLTDGFIISGVDRSDAGTSVAGAGDINGDGFDDLLVSAPNYSATIYNANSSSYVIFGKASNTNVELSDIDTAPSGTTGFRLSGFSGTTEREADSVATGGDINGDGYDDIVFGGSKTNVDGLTGVGAAYVLFGQESGFTNLNISDVDGTNGFIFTDSDTYSSTEASIGAAVSIAGDINGDGLDDLIVGAPTIGTERPSGEYDGEVYVVFGRTSFSSILNGNHQVQASSLDGNIGFRATGLVGEQARTGNSISSGGDINGDGIDDFIIGAPGDYYGNGSPDGRAYVVFGKNSIGSSGTLNLLTLGTDDGFELRGDGLIELAGTSVSIAGDINGDGFDDILVGAESFDSDAQPYSDGAAYVIFGDSDIDVPANLGLLDGENGFAILGNRDWYAGAAVAIAGDINGDGFDDLLVSEPQSDAGGTVTFLFGQDFDLRDGNTANGELGPAVPTARQQIDGDGSNTLTADQGSNSDILVGGRGNDTLIADGGADVLIGGQGDDVLTAELTNFAAMNPGPRFDGGTGVDTLTGGISFSGAMIDLTLIPDNRINDIEIIDLEDSVTETITLDLATVLAITGSAPTTASSSPFATNDSHTLVILKDDNDVINGIDAGNGWTQGTNETIDGKTFEVFTQAGATVKIQSAVAVDGDVNEDGMYDATDGVLIALVKAFFPPSSIEANRGASSLTAAQIQANVAELDAANVLDVNQDGMQDATDGVLIALVKAFFPPSSIEANRGASSLNASQIQANVNAIPPPQSGRLASPGAPAEDTQESEQIQQQAFQAPPPDPLILDDDSDSEPDHDQAGQSNETISDSEDGSSDQAFVASQIDVTMDLLS